MQMMPASLQYIWKMRRCDCSRRTGLFVGAMGYLGYLDQYSCLRVGSFILMDQCQTRGPDIFVLFKIPYTVVRCYTDAAVLNIVPHSTVIGAVPGTVESYQVDQPLFVRLVIACCNQSSRIDLTDDVFETYPINTYCTPHLC